MHRPPRESSRARFYHDVQLRGPVPQRLLFYPEVSTAPSPPLIDAALAWSETGDMSPQTPAGAEAFHRFDWLPILSGAGQEGSEAIRRLITFWLEHYGRFMPTTWRASVCAQRLIRMLCHMDILTSGMDGPLRHQLHDSAARQARHLARFLRKGREKSRLPIVVARTLASLCLPEDKHIGGPDVPRLGALLRPLAEGALPSGWRDVNAALQEADDLFILSEAFLQRRLSPPPELLEVIKVARLYIGGFLTGSGGMVQLPGRHAPDRAALTRIDPIIRPEADVLLSQMGYLSRRHGEALVVADMGYKDELSGTGALALAIGPHPFIINCGQPSGSAIGLTDRMAAWADALSSPAAASGYEIPALSPATALSGDDGPLAFRYPTRNGEITRALDLSSSGDQLVTGDEIPFQSLHQRLHIGAGADINREGEVIKIAFGDEVEASMTIEGATADIEESVSAWCDGRIDKVYQIVMSPCASAIRWRINWQ